MLNELFQNIIKEQQALREIFISAEFNIRAIRGLMDSLDITSISIYGFKFDTNKCGYTINGEKVNSIKSHDVDTSEADAVYQFVKLYPVILQELTNQAIDASNADLESSLKILKDKMVEVSL